MNPGQPTAVRFFQSVDMAKFFTNMQGSAAAAWLRAAHEVGVVLGGQAWVVRTFGP